MKISMKKVALLIAGVLFINLAQATLHSVTVMNYEFTPNSFSAEVGDTVQWTWVNGGHTTTSTSVPTGAATWSHPMNSSSTSFEYVITVPGTYNYWCAIHTTMMEASFTVTTTAIPVVSHPSKIIASILPNPSPGQFILELQPNRSNGLIKIYDVTGKEIYQSVLSNSKNSIDLSSEPAGTYFIYMKSKEDEEIEKILILK
jgi:plastocyanin